MKENSIKNERSSIEEEIMKAQHFINSIRTDKDYENENGWHGYYNTEIVELARILEHILSDYKRVLKENEELIERNKYLVKYRAKLEEELYKSNEYYIPKSVIQDKIEKFRCKLTWGYNDWKYDEKIYQAEYKIIYDIEKELLNKGE